MPFRSGLGKYGLWWIGYSIEINKGLHTLIWLFVTSFTKDYFRETESQVLIFLKQNILIGQV